MRRKNKAPSEEGLIRCSNVPRGLDFRIIKSGIANGVPGASCNYYYSVFFPGMGRRCSTEAEVLEMLMENLLSLRAGKFCITYHDLTENAHPAGSCILRGHGWSAVLNLVAPKGSRRVAQERAIRKLKGAVRSEARKLSTVPAK